MLRESKLVFFLSSIFFGIIDKMHHIVYNIAAASRGIRSNITEFAFNNLIIHFREITSFNWLFPLLQFAKKKLVFHCLSIFLISSELEKKTSRWGSRTITTRIKWELLETRDIHSVFEDTIKNINMLSSRSKYKQNI